MAAILDAKTIKYAVGKIWLVPLRPSEVAEGKKPTTIKLVRWETLRIIDGCDT